MSDFIMLKNVRVSFPHLFDRPVINGDEGKCGAALMLDNSDHAKDIAGLNKQIDALAKEKFKNYRLPSAKKCLMDGDEKGRPEYEGYHILSANAKDRPKVIAADGRTIIANRADCQIYAGCYAHAKVRLWAQDNQYGKRINCELVAIQFAKNGAPLDGSHVSDEEAIEGFGEAEDAFFGGDDDDFLAA